SEMALVALAVCVHAATSQQPSFIDLGNNYADHEILQEEDLMVFQTGSTAWIGRIDPATGAFVAGDGREWLVDSDISSLQTSRNGPEFGIDSGGWTVWYNTNSGPRVRITRATPTGGFGSPFLRETLTGVQFDRVNQLPSQNANDGTTYVLYGRGAISGFDRDIAYLSEADPANDIEVTPLTPGAAGFRWIDNSSELLSTIGDLASADYGQIVLIDASTGEREVITDDPGIKFDPFGWLAPEFGGARLAIAALDESDIAVYREAEPFWERIAVLSPPVESGLSFVQSPEPFVAGGRSYVVTTLKNAEGPVIGGNVTESQVWLYGIDDRPDRRFAMRVDDPSGAFPVRHEGEAYLGADELFIYYNDVRPTGIGMVLTRTGIRLDLPGNCFPADRAPPYGILSGDDALRLFDEIEDGDAAADLDDDGDIDIFDAIEFFRISDACGGV
ncbi:MAG: hypothetical protein AAFU70_11510, partial [Planctomycetota bacterium]